MALALSPHLSKAASAAASRVAPGACPAAGRERAGGQAARWMASFPLAGWGEAGESAGATSVRKAACCESLFLEPCKGVLITQ